MLVRFSTLALAASVFSGPALVFGLTPSDIPSDTPVSKLLGSAAAHLSRGETNDALVYYDAAIARDPSNYLTFFKRATTYLSLGRSSQALEDFNKVLALKPGFEGAHVQLAKLRARSGDWNEARVQYKASGKSEAAPELLELQEAQSAAALAAEAMQKENWEECVSKAGVAIAVASRAASLREIRARCRFEKGELEEGMGDLQHLLHMKPGDVLPHLVVSAVTFYAMGDLQNGMASIRKCLHSDPDSTVCKKLLKDEKAVDKAMQKISKALDKGQPMTAVRQLVQTDEEEGLIQQVKTQVQALKEKGTIPKTAGNVLVARLVEMACRGYYESNSKKAREYCEESLELDEKSYYGLLYRSRTQMDAEDFEAAVRTLETASNVRPDKRDEIKTLMDKAQIALKRSKTKDYYKVLGVAHDADERQIKSAYRKLSKQHHPDKAAQQGLTKEHAEKKMAAINEAYEVLSNPELRERFDRGDDPNSHEQPNHFQGNPFGAGGHPFMFQQGAGGGGQGFKVHFGSGGGGFPGGFPGGFRFG